MLALTLEKAYFAWEMTSTTWEMINVAQEAPVSYVKHFHQETWNGCQKSLF